MMRLPSASRRRARRGAASVEAAVVLGVLFLVIFGIFEYGRFLMVYNLAEFAAREGARTAATMFTAGRTPAQLTAETQQVVTATRAALCGADGHLQNVSVGVTWADPATGAPRGAWYAAPYADPVAVRVSATYVPMISLILPAAVQITVQGTAASEAN
jgi:Flp pilus assembly protein TadG